MKPVRALICHFSSQSCLPLGSLKIHPHHPHFLELATNVWLDLPSIFDFQLQGFNVVMVQYFTAPPICSATRDQLVSASLARGDGHIVSVDWLQSELEFGEPDEKLHHKWCYMHDQQPDSDPKAKSNRTPHTNVHIPGTENETMRWSIELRCFVIFE